MIGVFDSGLGGLSVLAALVGTLPQADYVYFADSAHTPYGDKSDAFIESRVLAIGDHLISVGCTLLVVACNTATVAAIDALRLRHPGIPIVGVEPGIKPAARSSVSRKIAVLVTESTARSERLARLIREHGGDVSVHIEPCPGWATNVEQCRINDSAMERDARERLEPLLDNGIDRIVLGCTHYSFLSPLLRTIASPRATLIDVAGAVAVQAGRLHKGSGQERGEISLSTSGEPERLRAALPLLGLHALQTRVRNVTRVEI